MGQEIVISPDEIELAAIHAVTRRVAHHRNGRREMNVNGITPWDHEIEAACAELAYCKSRGVYWTGAEQICGKDGANVEIRWTKHTNGGLIAYAKDPDDHFIVLMDGKAPRFQIVGYLLARDAKQKEFLTTHGYYLVPRERIHPIQKNKTLKGETTTETTENGSG
jgi:hypothetical protein